MGARPATGDEGGAERAWAESLEALLERGVPREPAAEWLRVLRDSLQRVAEAEARLVGETFGQEGDVASRLTEATGPLVQRMHAALVRRAIERDLARGAGERGAIDATIVFVDVVSFTPLTDERGDLVAIEVLQRLDQLVRVTTARQGGDLVKQIGDAFMLEFEAPREAVLFALALRRAVGDSGSLPSLRMGVNAGPVLYRLGDYLGQTVNVAARLCDAAARDEILTTHEVAEAAARAGARVEAVEERTLKGLPRPMPLFRVEGLRR